MTSFHRFLDLTAPAQAGSGWRDFISGLMTICFSAAIAGCVQVE